MAQPLPVSEEPMTTRRTSQQQVSDSTELNRKPKLSPRPVLLVSPTTLSVRLPAGWKRAI